MHIVARVDTAGALTNTASVSASEVDPVPGNNAGQATVDASSGELPATGTGLGSLMPWAAVLVILGGGLVCIGRRRRGHQPA